MIVIALLHSIKESAVQFKTRKQLHSCSSDTLKDLGISESAKRMETRKANGVTFLVDVCRKTLREMRD